MKEPAVSVDRSLARGFANGAEREQRDLQGQRRGTGYTSTTNK